MKHTKQSTNRKTIKKTIDGKANNKYQGIEKQNGFNVCGQKKRGNNTFAATDKVIPSTFAMLRLSVLATMCARINSVYARCTLLKCNKPKRTEKLKR